MNEMYPIRSYRDDYKDYREDYRDYRDEYGRNQRDRYGRNYRDRYGRNYRAQEDFYMMLEDIVDDGMELARSYEDASEMANNNNAKNKLMKMADREKEHYKAVKDMLENRM